jgi:hypothetical protein
MGVVGSVIHRRIVYHSKVVVDLAKFVRGLSARKKVLIEADVVRHFMQQPAAWWNAR